MNQNPSIDAKIDEILRNAIDLSISIDMTLPQHEEHLNATKETLKQLIQEERLDEQMNTMTTRYKSGPDGYGQIYYIINGDELISQQERINELSNPTQEDK